ncbi:hypothetical protein FACS1894113_4950 [Alphaproteobacteria bacterium]|nr:hypothetical protein FACS1894113_4950 [Alphaproteobacteria bacterium]
MKVLLIIFAMVTCFIETALSQQQSFEKNEWTFMEANGEPLHLESSFQKIFPMHYYFWNDLDCVIENSASFRLLYAQEFDSKQLKKKLISADLALACSLKAEDIMKRCNLEIQDIIDHSWEIFNKAVSFLIFGNQSAKHDISGMFYITEHRMLHAYISCLMRKLIEQGLAVNNQFKLNAYDALRLFAHGHAIKVVWMFERILSFPHDEGLSSIVDRLIELDKQLINK